IYALNGVVRETDIGVSVPSDVESLLSSVCRRREAVSTKTEAKRRLRVVLDPGHGGKFSGATQNGIDEKELNLDVALKVRSILVGRGVDVVMTRTTDTHLDENWSKDLDCRVEISNRANADLFVSIHANSDTRRDSRGSDVFIARESEDANERVARSLQEAPTLAEQKGVLNSERSFTARKIVHRLLFEEKFRRSYILAECVSGSLRRNPHDSFNKISDCGFRVVKWTRAPAVLVEMGYISNPQTAAMFLRRDYRDFVAKLIAEGLLEYIERSSSSCDFSDSGQKREEDRKEKRVQPRGEEGASYSKEREEELGRRK
ncbi:MAG: N-acetylmuramoyl-L-alanine amidase, partial [Planctomycetota bacterium]|nr:N-acetylmuramoyl-L-alanine amidase [Planctomycetota bacterium]